MSFLAKATYHAMGMLVDGVWMDTMKNGLDTVIPRTDTDTFTHIVIYALLLTAAVYLARLVLKRFIDDEHEK